MYWYICQLDAGHYYCMVNKALPFVAVHFCCFCCGSCRSHTLHLLSYLNCRSHTSHLSCWHKLHLLSYLNCRSHTSHLSFAYIAPDQLSVNFTMILMVLQCMALLEFINPAIAKLEGINRKIQHSSQSLCLCNNDWSGDWLQIHLTALNPEF